MVNWNKVIKTLKNIAEAHSHVKATQAALLSSPANGIWAVKQSAKDHEKALKSIARVCDKCGICSDTVFVLCESCLSNDEKVKALLFNRNIIESVVEACFADDTNDTNYTDDKEE